MKVPLIPNESFLNSRHPLLDQMKTLVDVRKTKVTEDFDEETEETETALLIEELSQAKSSII